jgi:hypothetical protein
MPSLREKLNQSLEQKSSSLWAGCLYKGERREKFISKKDGKEKLKAGKDINEKLRFEPYSNHARLAMLAAYPDAKKDHNGDILLDEIDIFAAFDSVDETFKVQHQRWDSTGLAATCDGNKIVQTRELYTDDFKHKRTRMIPCGKPCPIANKPLGAICPNECKQEAELVFYIPQLVDAGVGLPVKMTLHAWSDLESVSDCLAAISKELDQIRTENGINPDSNIKLSPFLCGSPGNVILLKLNRNKDKIRRPIMENGLRTGKKTEGEVWAISISFHPAYLAVLRQWQNAIAFSKITLPYAPTGLLEQVRLTPIAALPAAQTEIQIIDAETITTDNWKTNCLSWALKQGLKHETILAIIERSKSKAEFMAFCDKALAIKWAKDSGIDEPTAKKLLKESLTIENFKTKIEAILNQVDQIDLIAWAVTQGLPEEKAAKLFAESIDETDFKDKVHCIIQEF